jgi:hypothetical protein
MEAPTDPTSMAVLVACVTHIAKTLVDAYVGLVNRTTGATSGGVKGEVNEVHAKDMDHLQYQIDELKQEGSYSRRWRHWMANQMQKLMSKAGIDPDPLPTE